MIPVWKLIPRVAGCVTKRNIATARVIIPKTDRSDISGQRSTVVCGDSGIVDQTFKVRVASFEHDIHGLNLKGIHEKYTTFNVQQEPYVIKQDESELDPHIPLYDKCLIGMSSCTESNVPYPAGPFDAITGYSNYCIFGAGRRRVNKYLYAGVHATHPSRHFSTSGPSMSQGGQPLQYMDTSAPTPQGIQGDQCVSFKLWLENCVRYGLPSCDEQLHDINSGRKTLAQVFAEQQELIKEVAEKYRRGEVKSKAAADGMLKSTISEHSPSTQGIQGDECVRYKLWLENCRRFEFRDCEENIRAVQSGRKTLSQVFEEQDRQIQEIVQQYQQHRHYSTTARDDKRD
ncbi:hypothetical protein CHS0354_035065 [Potamilus streckersoni]|uniref:Uncharacterized protein n=1 Tax=Potamilus streckersoni TaxID=2493646 RepID=A0AAE0VQJ6_9BIVA|nr:hypothetical protein CHS0354_035065 [Potamilus streckersoni]